MPRLPCRSGTAHRRSQRLAFSGGAKPISGVTVPLIPDGQGHGRHQKRVRSVPVQEPPLTLILAPDGAGSDAQPGRPPRRASTGMPERAKPRCGSGVRRPRARSLHLRVSACIRVPCQTMTRTPAFGAGLGTAPRRKTAPPENAHGELPTEGSPQRHRPATRGAKEGTRMHADTHRWTGRMIGGHWRRPQKPPRWRAATAGRRHRLSGTAAREPR